MKIKNAADLRQTILNLEIKRKIQEETLAAYTGKLLKSIKPANLLKCTINAVASSPAVSRKILNSVIGWCAGMLVKKIVIRRSHDIFKKIAGAALEYIIANAAAKNADKIKNGFMFLKAIFLRKKEVLRIPE